MAGDKSNVLIALVGRSGAGKSVSAKYLEDIYGLKYLRSYTTREKIGIVLQKVSVMMQMYM